jgi:hypothetical protein
MIIKIFERFDCNKGVGLHPENPPAFQYQITGVESEQYAFRKPRLFVFVFYELLGLWKTQFVKRHRMIPELRSGAAAVGINVTGFTGCRVLC